MQQIIEIKVDVPDGYVAVDIRPPKSGERFIGLIGGVFTCHEDSMTEYRVIVKPDFIWPDWVKPGTWYAMDAGGEEYLYDDEPRREPGVWVGLGCVRIRDLRRIADFPSPPKTDWRASLRQKPL